MAPKPWASPEQLVFLEARVVSYRKHQAEQSLTRFRVELYREWFQTYPERDVVFPGRTEALTEEELAIVAKANEDRKSKLRNCRCEDEAARLAKKEYTRGQKLILIKHETCEAFKHETDEVKAEIEGEVRAVKEAEAETPGEGESQADGNISEASRQAVIDDLPAVFGQFFGAVHAKTKFYCMVFAVGKEPGSDKMTILTVPERYHSEPPQREYNFSSSIPDFKGRFVRPFAEYVKDEWTRDEDEEREESQTPEPDTGAPSTTGPEDNLEIVAGDTTTTNSAHGLLTAVADPQTVEEEQIIEEEQIVEEEQIIEEEQLESAIEDPQSVEDLPSVPVDSPTTVVDNINPLELVSDAVPSTSCEGEIVAPELTGASAPDSSVENSVSRSDTDFPPLAADPDWDESTSMLDLLLGPAPNHLSPSDVYFSQLDYSQFHPDAPLLFPAQFQATPPVRHDLRYQSDGGDVRTMALMGNENYVFPSSANPMASMPQSYYPAPSAYPAMLMHASLPTGMVPSYFPRGGWTGMHVQGNQVGTGYADDAQPAMPTTIQPLPTTTIQPAMPTTVQPAMPTTVQPAMPTTVQPLPTTTIQPAMSTTVQPAMPTTVQPLPTTTVQPAMLTTVQPLPTTTVQPAMPMIVQPPRPRTVQPSPTTATQSPPTTAVQPPPTMTVQPALAPPTTTQPVPTTVAQGARPPPSPQTITPGTVSPGVLSLRENIPSVTSAQVVEGTVSCSSDTSQGSVAAARPQRMRRPPTNPDGTRPNNLPGGPDTEKEKKENRDGVALNGKRKRVVAAASASPKKRKYRVVMVEELTIHSTSNVWKFMCEPTRNRLRLFINVYAGGTWQRSLQQKKMVYVLVRKCQGLNDRGSAMFAGDMRNYDVERPACASMFISGPRQMREDVGLHRDAGLRSAIGGRGGGHGSVRVGELSKPVRPACLQEEITAPAGGGFTVCNGRNALRLYPSAWVLWFHPRRAYKCAFGKLETCGTWPHHYDIWRSQLSHKNDVEKRTFLDWVAMGNKFAFVAGGVQNLRVPLGAVDGHSAQDIGNMLRWPDDSRAGRMVKDTVIPTVSLLQKHYPSMFEDLFPMSKTGGSNSTLVLERNDTFFDTLKF
ncbi:uncharacterized protein B0H18DRAFT_964817, partial [Fomitopsis serialis]|uniref:uncharacterized protein n=1 Tax=Fomitopsis serialis TaxID=139415 RepID=UPI0020078621